MILLVGAFLVSLIPAVALFLWMRNGLYKDRPVRSDYGTLCNKALVRGLAVTAMVVLVSGVLHIGGNILGARSLPPVVEAFYHTFFVLAFSEELCKTFMLKRLIDTNPDRGFSWLDIIVFMTCIGIGFELLESLIYGFSTGPQHMLVRGFTVMHAAFALIMGYFYGKGLRTGSKLYLVLGFVVPWIMHGLYDFCISEAVMTWNENLGFISLVLAVACAIIAVGMVFFLRKARDLEVYTEPMDV